MTISSKHHAWHGQRHLVWEKREKNENLISIGGEEICNQQETKYRELLNWEPMNIEPVNCHGV